MKNQRYMGLAFGLLAGVVVLRVVGVSLGSLGLLAVVLACPLMMFLMMRSMSGTGHDTHDRDNNTRDDSAPGRI